MCSGLKNVSKSKTALQAEEAEEVVVEKREDKPIFRLKSSYQSVSRGLEKGAAQRQVG